MLRARGREGNDLAVGRHREAGDDGDAGREERLGLAAGARHALDGGLDASVHGVADRLGVLPDDARDVAFEAGQHVGEGAGLRIADHEAAGGGVVDVLAGDEGEVAPVRAPRHRTELAGVLDAGDDGAGLGVEDVDALLHVVVVHVRRRRDGGGDAVAGGAPGDVVDRAGEFDHPSGVVHERRGDPEPAIRGVLFVDLGLVGQHGLALFLRLLGHKRDAVAGGAPVVDADGGAEGEGALHLAGRRVQHVERRAGVAVGGAGEEGEAAVGGPADAAEGALAGPEAGVLVGAHVVEVELGVRAGVRLERVPRDTLRVGDAVAIGRDVGRADGLEAGDVGGRETAGLRERERREEEEGEERPEALPGERNRSHGQHELGFGGAALRYARARSGSAARGFRAASYPAARLSPTPFALAVDDVSGWWEVGTAAV